MAEKQKPDPKLVRQVAKDLPRKKPNTVFGRFLGSMEGRILADEKNDPEPHRPVFRYLGRKQSPRGGRRTSPRR
jgi:hypothetical protein